MIVSHRPSGREQPTVTMALLSANLLLFLLATVLIGSTFLGIQIYEYRQLLFEHDYPIGISKTGHFSPDVSLFASTFFTMTGFHGAHVLGGLILLGLVLYRAATGQFSSKHHVGVAAVTLYWHFVDVVWIFLFGILYVGVAVLR